VGSKFRSVLSPADLFNFHSVHFTQEHTPIIMYISCVSSDRLKTKRTKFGPHEYFLLYGSEEARGNAITNPQSHLI